MELPNRFIWKKPPTQRDRHMDYHKTTIALIAWLVWGGDKKTADEIGRDEYDFII